LVGARTVLSVSEQLLEVDERGRTTLGTPRGVRRRYLETDLPDGTIVLHPAVVMSEVQARLLTAPSVLAAVTRANTRSDSELVARPRRQRRPSAAS
jgi:hypothetical protein